MVTRAVRGIVAWVVAATLVSACRRDATAPRTVDLASAIGQLSVEPIDSLGGEVSPIGLDLSEDGTVVGNLTIAGTTSGFRWSRGTFTMLPTSPGGSTVRGMNNLGDIVGVAGGRPVIWYAGDVVPTPIFRPDTDFVIASALDVNDRREVYMYLNGRTSAVWFRGTYRVASTLCSLPIGINNQGVVAFETCGQTHDNWVLVPPPFGESRLTVSGKLRGTGDCARARESVGLAVNDSNEVIGSAELSATTGAHADVWTAGGCQNLSIAYPGLTLRSFNSRGLLGGWTIVGVDTSAVLAMDGQSVVVDRLLGPAAGWHLTQVLRITDTGRILAYGYQLTDGRRAAVLLTPSKR